MIPESITITIAISAISLMIASLALGWNVYRDVILRPRVRVTFSISALVFPGDPDSTTTVLGLTGVNHGPGVVTCNLIVVKKSSWWRKVFRKQKWGIIHYSPLNQWSATLPKAIAVGETVSLLLPYDQNCLLKDDYTHVGIADSFGRYHWAPRKSVSDGRTTYEEKFGSNAKSAGVA